MVILPPGQSGAEYAFVSNAGMATVSTIHLTSGLVKSIPTATDPKAWPFPRTARNCSSATANRPASP
jgi:hypothetical protein